jgi:hypothetical protein
VGAPGGQSLVELPGQGHWYRRPSGDTARAVRRAGRLRGGSSRRLSRAVRERIGRRISFSACATGAEAASGSAAPGSRGRSPSWSDGESGRDRRDGGPKRKKTASEGSSPSKTWSAPGFRPTARIRTLRHSRACRGSILSVEVAGSNYEEVSGVSTQILKFPSF